MKAVCLAVLACALVIQGQRFRPVPAVAAPKSQPSHEIRASTSGFNCPDKNGRYPTNTCDGYIECQDGVPEEKLCPDGLLFNPAAGVFAFPCQYPIDVDCTGRETVQQARSTAECPHAYGYFKVGDDTHCGQYMNCVDGRSYLFDCPEGLAWSEDTYRCDWPDMVQDCNAEAFLGFTCPDTTHLRGSGLGEPGFGFYRSATDCQRYYICVNDKPRLYNCGEGKAFNELFNACDGVENVTGCADNFNPEFQKSTVLKG